VSGKRSLKKALSTQQSAKKTSGFATLCRPDTWNEKTGLKLGRIRLAKNAKNRFDRSVDSTVELGFGFCFQQNA
jgi:hypothetical protein